MLSINKTMTLFVIFSLILLCFLVSSVLGSGGAVEDSVICNKDGSVLIDVLANDIGLGQIGAIGSPKHGTAVIENGKVRYTPDSNWYGIDKFTYTAIDEGLFFDGTGHYYEYVPSQGILWTVAKDAAASKEFYGLKGYLVTITSEEENEFVVSKLNGSGWMGASDFDNEGNWFWVTGPELGTKFYNDNNNTTLIYSNWAPDEPNNVGENEHYANFVFDTESFEDGTWNVQEDKAGACIKGYIVEYGGIGTLNLPTTTVSIVVLNNSTVPIHVELKASYDNRLKTVDSLQSQILNKLPAGCKQNGVSSSGCSVSENVKSSWNEAQQNIQNAKKTGNVIKALNDLKKGKEIFEQILRKI
jgi:hypothetical protein